MDLNITFIIFNRPDTTKIVFEEIRRARPKRLFVIADGPRPERKGEAERCEEARRIIEEGVDWDCEVYKNFSQANQGCRNRPPSGLDWVFQHVEHSIILEDDCVPDPTFFPFCQELLARYLNDDRIMMISGDNFLFGKNRTPHSYYFSGIPHIWGWATWKRAWDKYDRDIQLWPSLREGSWMNDLFDSQEQVKVWTKSFEDIINGFDTWDYQWALACLVNRGLCIMPSVNLISNIGFGPTATHTLKVEIGSKLPTEKMLFPLRHPEFMIRDKESDLRTFALFHGMSKTKRAKQAVKKILKIIFFSRNRGSSR